MPFAKARLGVDDGALGLLLLCIGIGSVCAMAVTGGLAARHGARPIIVVSGFVLAAVLPVLAIAPTALLLGASLLFFGGALGSINVAMNMHAVDVETGAGRPMMSGFHALFSVGGFAGSILMTGLLSFGLGTLVASLTCAALVLAAIATAWPRLLANRSVQGGPLLTIPHGIVLLLAGLAAVTFLVEGAMLDWGALLVSGKGLLTRDQAGLGYTLFALAMTAGRLVGDRVTARVGEFTTLVAGGSLAVVGLIVLVVVPVAVGALAGFLVIGLGASNVVPILLRLTGRQSVMPPALAVAAISTMGYAGILVGPALIGFIASATGLPMAFLLLAGLMSLVPLTARAAAGPRDRN